MTKEWGRAALHDLVFTDRVLVTAVHLRHQLPHAALAELYGLERSTITRAIGEIRPLPAERASPKQNTCKTTTISDSQGRTLWSGADRPGRMHDQTALRPKVLRSRSASIRE